MSNKLTVEQRYYIVEVTTRDIEDLCARLDPTKEYYVGQKQHDSVEHRLEILIDLRGKMLASLKARGTALHYLLGGSRPAFRDKLLAEKFQNKVTSEK